MGSSVSAVSGSSLIAPGPDGRSSRLSSSEGGPGERRPYACSLRNWVHVGPIRRGAGPSPPFSKHRGDGRGRDVDPELQELPSDPEVAPPWVLPSQPKDQVLDRGIERRTTGRPRARPASSLQQVPVPSRQRVRAHQEALPPVPGQDPSRRREERPIRRGEQGSPAAPAEDLELVVEHDGLDIQLIEAAADEHAEQPAQKPVPDGPQHPGSLTPGRPAGERPGRSGRSSFFTPQVGNRHLARESSFSADPTRLQRLYTVCIVPAACPSGTRSWDSSRTARGTATS
jgi:hypothetical protein